MITKCSPLGFAHIDLGCDRATMCCKLASAKSFLHLSPELRLYNHSTWHDAYQKTRRCRRAKPKQSEDGNRHVLRQCSTCLSPSSLKRAIIHGVGRRRYIGLHSTSECGPEDATAAQMLLSNGVLSDETQLCDQCLRQWYSYPSGRKISSGTPVTKRSGIAWLVRVS